MKANSLRKQASKFAKNYFRNHTEFDVNTISKLFNIHIDSINMDKDHAIIIRGYNNKNKLRIELNFKRDVYLYNENYYYSFDKFFNNIVKNESEALKLLFNTI